MAVVFEQRFPDATVRVVHRGETRHHIDYRDDSGLHLEVPFDPREDGPHVYVALEIAQGTSGPVNGAALDVVLDRMAEALDGFFPHDEWRMWTQSWPRFALRWKGERPYLVECWPPRWLQYGEPGRGIALDCDPTRTSGTRVRAFVPRSPRWSFPPDAGPIDPAHWSLVCDRLRTLEGWDVELVDDDRGGA